MSDKIVTISQRIGGTLTDLDTPPVFGDSGATYGLRRTDTLAVITPPTANVTPIPKISTGVYQYTFEDLVEGVPYEYWFRTVYTPSGAGTITTYHNRLFTAPDETGGTATSTFFTLTEFLNRWGAKNVRIASNKDNSVATYNYEALQSCFDYATSEIYQAFRGGIYIVPLDFIPNNNVVPETLKRWAMIIAYADLYDARGMDEKDRSWNKISIQLKATYADMRMHAIGLKQLPATLVGVGTAPMEASTTCIEIGYRYPDEVPTWR